MGACGGLTCDITDAIVWASGGKLRGMPQNQNQADVITVGASTYDGTRAHYSNFGDTVDIYAPGGDGISGNILTTTNTGTTV